MFEVTIPLQDVRSAVTLGYLEITGGTATGTGEPLGGGIKSTNANLSLDDCWIHGNSADTDGGGVWANGLTCRITVGLDTLISDNHTGGSGGGIAVLRNMEVNSNRVTKVELNGQSAPAPLTAPGKLGVFLENPAATSTFPTNADVTDDNYQFS